MSNPPRPSVLVKHPHRTPAHFEVYDGIRELAIFQSTGWHKSGVARHRLEALHPEWFLIMQQLAEWGVWNVEPYGPLGIRIWWDDYQLIVQGNETLD